jgi:hypothetical protein
MKVLNIAGYPFGFNHGGDNYLIPYDGQLHPLPDDIGEIKGLQIIVPPKEKPVNSIVNLTDSDLDNAVENEKSKVKPLKKVKIKKDTRSKLRKTKDTGPKKKKPDKDK